ncbi:MAG: PstS family phosphate ABC transporter substrate-binding protein [Nanoarchaeota archaeon]|nr:PstS family phosphate ABC transporter substrate-binding protein [Nanoarchaeota archaeon]
MKYVWLVLVLALVALSACSSPTGNVVSDQSLEIKGSDTLLQVVSNLAEDFSSGSDVRLSVTGGGSGTGIAALLNGEVDIADSSRPIKEEELAQGHSLGLDMVEVIVGRDMLSVIVNENNPVKRLSVDQVSRIYKGEITNWKEVGGLDQPITLYGRQSSSGTYVFFLEEIVRGEYAASMRNLEGNQAILQAVTQDKSGIGYVGLGYVEDGQGNIVSGITVLDIKSDGDYYSPLNKETLASYPISRALFQYLAKKPVAGSPLGDFIAFELSERGQSIVESTGFVALTAQDRAANEKALSSN